MSFPAYHMFRKDRRVTPTLMVVYEFLCEHADLHEKREFKADWIAAVIGEQDARHGVRQAGLPTRGRLHRPHIDTAIEKLIAWGYVIEHDKRPDRPRWLTLAYSVRLDLRKAG